MHHFELLDDQALDKALWDAIKEKVQATDNQDAIELYRALRKIDLIHTEIFNRKWNKYNPKPKTNS